MSSVRSQNSSTLKKINHISIYKQWTCGKQNVIYNCSEDEIFSANLTKHVQDLNVENYKTAEGNQRHK